MKVKRWLMFCTALGLVSALPAEEAASATISGRSSTVIEWSDEYERYGDANRTDASLPFYQYLVMNIKEIGDDNFKMKMYGRFANDLKDQVDVNSRLYYCFLEKKDFVEDLDFRLGRQFVSTVAGASIMDGLLLKYRNVGAADFTFFGGGDVNYDGDYNASKDLFYGAEVAFRSMDHYSLALSYVQKNENSEVIDDQAVGNSKDESIVVNKLAGMEAYYNFKGLANIYTDLQYNYSKETISYFLGGMKYYRSSSWTLRTEYLYSLPVFSDNSIYSVFAVDEYKEFSADLTYKLGLGLNAYLNYGREIYQDFDDADVFELGLEKIRTNKISGYISGVYRSAGDGQDLSGIKARISYYFNNYFQPGVGIHYDVYERQENDDDLEDDTSSSRIWLDVNSRLSKKVSLQAKIERVETEIWDEYYRGRVRLNVRF